MRSLLVVASILLTLFTSSAVGQKSEVEKKFETNKSRYTREHFAEGEDASSGYDYLYYKSGSKIVMIRSIWSASWSKELRVEDFFFDDDLLFVRKTIALKRQLGALKKGRNTLLTPKEEFHFVQRKLIKWIVGKKEMPTADLKWAETEKGILDQATSEYDNYKWLKEGK